MGGGVTPLLVGAVLLGAALPGATLWPAVARAEGTAQLGANQDLVEQTELLVDVVAEGEVINIAVGNNSATDPSPVRVEVFAPDGAAVTGSPFYVHPGEAGFLDTPDQVPGMISDPLQVPTSGIGTYTVRFDNTRSDMGDSPWLNVVDPFDITVTPKVVAQVDPAYPPEGYGRLHSKRWMLNAHTYSAAAASSARFYVLASVRPEVDHTWVLQLDGVSGNQYDVRANSVGLPAPLSARSVPVTVDPPCPAGYSSSSDGRCNAIPPSNQYDVYLAVPRVAHGGDPSPKLSELGFSGATEDYACSIAEMPSSFRFVSDSVGRYLVHVDLDRDGSYEADELIAQGLAVVGVNTVPWDGRSAAGEAVATGSYTVRLTLRVAEFHFVANDIETANPGLRIFSLSHPSLTLAPAPAAMHWDDSAINDRPLAIAPATTPAEGISSGEPSAPAVCSAPGQSGVNAHCWGDFGPDETRSPGDGRYIDTWVHGPQTSLELELCAGDESQLVGLGGGGGCAVARRPAAHRGLAAALGLALLLALACVLLRRRRAT